MKTALPNLALGRVQAVLADDDVTVEKQLGLPGRLFTVRIVQDSTGHAITFDASYVGIPEIPTTPNTYSAIPLEIDDSGNAYLCAAPVLGVPIP